jgi:hypothetical protein
MNIEALGELTSKSIIPPWIKWIALALLIVAGIVAIHAYGETQYQRGLLAGKDSKSTEWQSRENKELIAANEKIIQLQQQANNEEALHQQRVTTIVDYFQELNTNEKAKSDAVIRDLAAGDTKLRFVVRNTNEPSPTFQASASPPGQAQSSATSCDEKTEGELPPEIGASLYAEADRADEITRQLESCQALVQEDRRLCGIKQDLIQE